MNIREDRSDGMFEVPSLSKEEKQRNRHWQLWVKNLPMSIGGFNKIGLCYCDQSHNPILELKNFKTGTSVSILENKIYKALEFFGVE